nr:peptide chain release factor 2-like [Pan paniscus]
MPAAGERERGDKRARARRRRRRRRQRGRLSPRPELRLQLPGAGGAFPAEPRRHERGRPLTAARAGSQRARRPEELSQRSRSRAVKTTRPQPRSPAPKPQSRPLGSAPKPRNPAPTSRLRPQPGVRPTPGPVRPQGWCLHSCFSLVISRTCMGPPLYLRPGGLGDTAATKTEAGPNERRRQTRLKETANRQNNDKL